MGAEKNAERRSSEGGSIVWVDQGADPLAVYEAMIGVKPFLYMVVNYAAFISRKLDEEGFINEYSYRIKPTQNGYTITIEFRLRGVRSDVYEKLERRAQMIRLQVFARSARSGRRSSEEFSESWGEESEDGGGSEPEIILGSEDSKSEPGGSDSSAGSGVVIL